MSAGASQLSNELIMTQRNHSPLRSLLITVLKCQLCSVNDLTGLWVGAQAVTEGSTRRSAKHLAHVIIFLFSCLVYDVTMIFPVRVTYLKIKSTTVCGLSLCIYSWISSSRSGPCECWLKTGLLFALSHQSSSGTTDGTRY